MILIIIVAAFQFGGSPVTALLEVGLLHSSDYSRLLALKCVGNFLDRSFLNLEKLICPMLLLFVDIKVVRFIEYQKLITIKVKRYSLRTSRQKSMITIFVRFNVVPGQ